MSHNTFLANKIEDYGIPECVGFVIGAAEFSLAPNKISALPYNSVTSLQAELKQDTNFRRAQKAGSACW